MKDSIGMTNAAVLPEPAMLLVHLILGSATHEHTGFSNTNDVSVLHTNRDRLTLDGGRLLVSNLVHNIENLLRYWRLSPRPQRVWNLTAYARP